MVSFSPAGQGGLWTLDADGELRALSRGWLEAALAVILPAGGGQWAAAATLADLERAYPGGGFVDPGDLQDRLWLDLVAAGEPRRARVLARPARPGQGLTVRGTDRAVYRVDRGRLLERLHERCCRVEGVDPDRLCQEAAGSLVSGVAEPVLSRALAPYGRAWLGALGLPARH